MELVYIFDRRMIRETTLFVFCSRTRVAPLKTITSLRLELCGAVILVNLAAQVVQSLDITFHKITFWADSTIVLGWINTSPNLLKPFDANRVSDIQELSQNATWQYVNTTSNPADVLSREISPSRLK